MPIYEYEEVPVRERKRCGRTILRVMLLICLIPFLYVFYLFMLGFLGMSS